MFFGAFAETFEFAIEDIGKEGNWKMAEDSPAINEVYKFNVFPTI